MTDWTSHIISVQYQEIMMTSKDSKLRKNLWIWFNFSPKAWELKQHPILVNWDQIFQVG